MMATTREALETTIALEKESMSLYARLAKLFGEEPKFQDFWFGMARDEARHVGALDLVWTVLDLEDKLDAWARFRWKTPPSSGSAICWLDSIARPSRDCAFSAPLRWHSKSKKPSWKIWSLTS